MKKKKRLLISLGIVLLCAGLCGGTPLLIFPSWRRIVIGAARGETFVRGMPRSSWVEALEDGSVDARIEAVKVLGELSVQVEYPDPALIAALKDENADVRLTAAVTLGKLGRGYKDNELRVPAARRAIPALVAALRDSHGGVRREAARSLSRISRDAAAAALIEALQEDNASVRATAVRAFGEYYWHPQEDRVVRALCKALKDDSPLVRRNAARTLGRIGSKGARPVLQEALKDVDAGVRKYAARSLKMLDVP